MSPTIYADVPQRLWDLLNTIDFEQLSQEDLQAWLQELHEYAPKYLPLRNGVGSVIAERGKYKIARSVPIDVIQAVQRYAFDNIPATTRTLFVAGAKMWMKQNLPLKNK